MAKPFKWENMEPETFQAMLDDYFNNTKQEEWTVTGLALHLECDRDTLLNYEQDNQGQSEKVDPEIIRLIKKAKMMVHNAYELDLRKKARSGDIFALKNFGWRDDRSFDHTTKGKELPTPIMGGSSYTLTLDEDEEGTTSTGTTE